MPGREFYVNDARNGYEWDFGLEGSGRWPEEEESHNVLGLRVWKYHDRHVMIKNLLDLYRIQYMHLALRMAWFLSLNLNYGVLFLSGNSSIPLMVSSPSQFQRNA